MSEIFRFVMLRAPEQAKDDDIVLLATGSEFQKALAEARKGAEPRVNMRAHARTFVSDAPLKDRAARAEWIADYENLHVLLERLTKAAEEEGAPASNSDAAATAPAGIPLERWFQEIFDKDLERFLASEGCAIGWQRVADTLVALKIVSGAPGGVVEDFSGLAHLYALLRRAAPLRTITVAWLRRALDATLVVPEEQSLAGLPPAQPSNGDNRVVVLPPAGTNGSARLERVRAVISRLVREEEAPPPPIALGSAPDASARNLAVTGGEIPNDVRRAYVEPENARALHATYADVLTEAGVDLTSLTRLAALTRLTEFGNSLEARAPTTATRIGSNYWTNWSNTASFNSFMTLPNTVGSLQPVGLGDLLLVKQRTVGYESGEVAHVENVLRSETRERQHRLLKRTEDTVTVERETTRTDERDLQTTERFELKSEASQVIKEDHKFHAGVEVSAKFGENFALKANVSYDYQHSKEESTKRASTYSKDVTQRATNKIVERVREERVTKIITETEEKNLHSFANTGAGAQNISGVYQWVDKLVEAQVFDYGQRLLFDAMVPEPASFLLDALATKKPEGEELIKPDPFTLPPDQITEWNYNFYVNKYGVADATPPPVQSKRVAKGFDQMQTEGKDDGQMIKSEVLKIEDGYFASQAHLKSEQIGQEKCSLMVTMGRKHHWFNRAGGDVLLDMENVEGDIALTILAHLIKCYTLVIDIKIERTARKFAAWQLETHAKILKAYLLQKSAYYEKLAQLAISQGLDGGRNPDFNRRLERTELKKAAIALLTGQHFDLFGAIDENGAGAKFPRPNLAETALEGPYIRFFEQAFEWEEMTYVFYPYFWGRQQHWYQRAVLQDDDPVFAEFLRAGAARVVFPVRPGFADAILHYLETGELWNGGPLPKVTNPLYVHIIEELKERDKAPGSEKPYGKPWKFRLPTTLIKLRDDDKLPVLNRDWEPA